MKLGDGSPKSEEKICGDLRDNLRYLRETLLEGRGQRAEELYNYYDYEIK